MSKIEPGQHDIGAAEREDGPMSSVGAFVSEHPLAAAGAAIAAGAVIGLLIPGFRRKAAVAGGSAIARTVGKATKALATAETVRAVVAGVNSAKESLRSNAAKVADHIPDADTVKASAKRALASASDAAQKVGDAAQKAGVKVAAETKKAAAKAGDF